MLLILAAAAVSGLSAPAASAGQAGAAEESVKSVKEARRLNPTSAELILSDDAPDIFRLFRDDNGGIVRNPEAEPHADILVQNPRKGVYYTIEEADGSWNLSTGVILVSFDKEDGTMSVRDLRSGRDVLRQSAPVLFETRGGKARTVLTLTESPDEYFYGGGVQNGRFSHKGRVINIVLLVHGRLRHHVAYVRSRCIRFRSG